MRKFKKTLAIREQLFKFKGRFFSNENDSQRQWFETHKLNFERLGPLTTSGSTFTFVKEPNTLLHSTLLFCKKISSARKFLNYILTSFFRFLFSQASWKNVICSAK